MDEAHRRRPAGLRPGAVRLQHPRDRRAARTTRPASQSLQDLAEPDVNLVVCAPEVPCGAAAADGRRGRRRRADAGQRGAVGHRRARQGHLRRGRRRAGLRHRRDRRRRRRRRASSSRSRARRSTSTRSPPSPTARTPTWPRSSSTWSLGDEGQQILDRRRLRPALSGWPDMARSTATSACRRWIYVPAAAGAAFVLLPLAAIVTPGRRGAASSS